MRGHLGLLGASWEAPWSKKFKTTALAHKNKGAPWVLRHILGSPLEPDVQNHCACAQESMTHIECIGTSWGAN